MNMDAMKLIKTGIKTARMIAKSRLRTRRQKRQQMITMGLIALGVVMVLVGGTATAVKMNALPVGKIKKKARELSRRVRGEDEDEMTSPPDFSSTGL